MAAPAASRPVIRAGPRIPARLLRLASDDRLVEQVRGGSEPAFEVLFDRHHRGVLAFCRHMLGTVDEAEDAVQHTFLAAYRDIVGSAKPIQLRPWLYAIARNRCLSILRARRERPVDEVPEPATEYLSAEVQRREDLRAMLADLAALPDDQRAALVLAEVGAVSHDEIAEVLDCPREKVKALVFQARSSLNASRTARDTSCAEIREQLANLRGGSLRRNTLRRHLRECEGCREFRAQMESQRRALALLLPVAPSLGLKESVLAGAFGGGGAAAAGGGAAAGGAAVSAGGAAAGGTGALAAKALVIVAIAGGGTVATVDAVRGPDAPARPAGAPAQGRPAPAPTAEDASRPGSTTDRGESSGGEPGARSGAGKSGTRHARTTRRRVHRKVTKKRIAAHLRPGRSQGRAKGHERDAGDAKQQQDARAERKAEQRDRQDGRRDAKADRRESRTTGNGGGTSRRSTTRVRVPKRRKAPVSAPAAPQVEEPVAVPTVPPASLAEPDEAPAEAKHG